MRLIDRLRGIARTSGNRRDNRKAIIFTEFADTAQYVHAAVAAAVAAAESSDPLALYRQRIAEPVRSTEGGADRRDHSIASFAPKTAGSPTSEDLYDILITTDVLAEGVNLHQAGKVINYDLPWNPMRLVQRHGRVDRIGSTHTTVEIDVFAPAARLDEMLKLMAKIEKKLGLAHATLGVPETIADMPGGGQGQLFQDGPDGLEIAKGILEGDDRWLTRRGSDTTSLGERWRLVLAACKTLRQSANCPPPPDPASSQTRYPSPCTCSAPRSPTETQPTPGWLQSPPTRTHGNPQAYSIPPLSTVYAPPTPKAAPGTSIRACTRPCTQPGRNAAATSSNRTTKRSKKPPRRACPNRCETPRRSSNARRR